MSSVNSNLIETKKVSELPNLPLVLTNYFAHCGLNGVLGKSTIDQLAVFMAPYITSVGASGYVATNGNVLSNPTSLSSAFTFVGIGTFTQTTGGSIVTTAPINILTWSGTTWSLSVAIPINLTGYLKTTDIVNNLNDGGVLKVLSSEMGKKIGNDIFGKQESSYNSTATDSLDWLLVKNEPFKSDGKLKKIKAVAYQNGKLKFQILRRTRFTGELPGSGDFFAPVSNFTIDVLAGNNEYDVDIDVIQGDYIGITKENPSINNPPLFSNATTINQYSWTTYASGIITAPTGMELRAYYVAFGYKLEYDLKQDRIITTRINATRNADNYNSIKNIMDSISDASFNRRYEIFVPRGSWFELDIRGKKYVKIICETADTLIYCDATQTAAKYIVPLGFPYPAEIGKQIATVSSQFLHLLFVSNDIDIEGGTLKMIRGKYTAHIDSNSFKNALFKNVNFISEQCIHPVGIGIWGGQKLTFDKCIFTSKDSEFGFAIHNTNNQTQDTETNILDCRWIGCSYLKIDELGSNRTDVINIFNATTDSNKSVLIATIPSDGTNSYWTDANGATTNNPLNVPYCFVVNDNGTHIEWLRIVFYFWSAYPNTFTRDIKELMKRGFGSYGFSAKCAGSIAKGDPVCMKNYGIPYIEVLKYGGTATTNIVGIALQNGVLGDVIYFCNNGNIAGTIVDGNPLANVPSAKLSFNESTGKLTPNPTAKPYEAIAQANGTDINGLYFAKIT